MSHMPPASINIIGGGPAGLMAAQHLLEKGYRVDLFDAMPSLGRKFLMAGKSGMNLTHSEPFEKFITRYADGSPLLRDALENFTPQDIRNWAEHLGIETFVGSSGRVFPTDFKAAPLLRAWLKHMRGMGLKTHVHHRWVGWQDEQLVFETPQGLKTISSQATLFACGGVSWPKLGSDGNWIAPFDQNKIERLPFKASNCGFMCNWSDHFRERFAGAPVKSVGLKVDEHQTKGEFVITQAGIEGSVVYTHSRSLRIALEKNGVATLWLDLCPDRSLDNVQKSLQKPKGTNSLSNHIRKTLKLDGVKMGLLRECVAQETMQDTNSLAEAIKALPVKVQAPQTIEEAISCAGGISFAALDDNLMVKSRPGTFAAGEMLDWDAPTGGYLLTACFALGKQAAHGIACWLQQQA